jgi:Flp pilus assembly protein TadD
MPATSSFPKAPEGMNGPNWLDRSREASDLLSRGRTDDAILIFQEVARANPRVPDAHNNLAVSLKTAGRLKEAVVSYRRALKLKPRLDVARLNLARVLRSLGQHDQALTAFANALRNTPDSEELHFEIRITFLNMQFDRPSSAAREILLSFFQNTAKDLQPFADPTTRLLLSNRRFQEL